MSAEEGVALFGCDLLSLGEAAHQITRKKHTENHVTFIVDRNISYSNVCCIDCDFCAFYCSSQSDRAFTLSVEEVLEKVEALAALGGTQVLIQGGVNPELPLDYYLEMVRRIHQRFPQICIHSFSVIEFDMLSKKYHIPLPEIFTMFREAGLNSLPGGGAEILSERVRKKISPKKTTSQRWLEVMREAHQSGLKSTATMVIGHVETFEDRIDHLMKIRALQDETGGFRAFIPWTLSPVNTPGLSHLSPTSGEDYLKTVAISRLMLDNFEHIQSGWLTEGFKLAQTALFFGCDDLGGTLLEDRVLEPTGIQVKTRKEDLIRIIREAGFVPVQRDTNYQVLRVYE